MTRARKPKPSAAQSAAPELIRPGHAEEQAADRMAGKLTPGTPAPQRKTNAPLPSEAARGEAARSIASGGAPLPAEERAWAEPTFGADLSQIRLHEKNSAAGRLNAEAYTHRNHIAFAPGAYRPGTPDGRRLLAHEITHSLQQRSGPPRLHRQERSDEAEAPATATTAPPQPAPLRQTASQMLDAFTNAEYDYDYGAENGHLSTIVRLHYADGVILDFNINRIEDRGDANQIQAWLNAEPGEAGRLFPAELTRTTLPRLWAVRQEVMRLMDEFNVNFIMGTIPAVMFIISLAGAPPLTGPMRATTRRTRRRGTAVQQGGGAAAAGSGGGAAQNFSIVGGGVYRYSGRDIVVVQTSAGRQAFYRRTGLAGTRGGSTTAAQRGDWAPFDGIAGGHFVKDRFFRGAADDVLHSFGTAENRAASEWLGRQNLPRGTDVNDAFGIINTWLRDLGAYLDDMVRAGM